MAVVASCGSSSRAAMPHRLDVLEATAEDVIDQIPKARWSRIDADVRTMAEAWSGYAQSARRLAPRQARRLDAALRDLALRAGARDGPGTEQAANDVSAPVVELMGRYSLVHPVAIGRLDVIGRQIWLDAGRQDLTAAAGSLGAAQREWAHVRDSVGRHDGASVVARTERLFGRLELAAQGGDLGGLADGARDLLELVDAMERLYRR